MSIIPSLPDILVNGAIADATQVMADFYQIQNDVNANAAANGANSDITSLTGLTTPLGVAYGGTGANTAGATAANNIGALAIANNLSDVSDAVAALTNIFPAGLVLPFAGLSIPSGWLLCYGQSLATSAYPRLFAAIGYAYGGAGASFSLPDLRGRGIAFLDNMGGSAANRITSAGCGIDGTVIGASGGDQNLQQHNHGITDPGHTHTYHDTTAYANQSGNATNCLVPPGFTHATSSSTTGITINNAGTGGSQNVQPTLLLNAIIKL